MGPAHHRHDGRQAAAEPQKGLLVGVLPPLVGVICQKRGLVGVLPLCHSLKYACATCLVNEAAELWHSAEDEAGAACAATAAAGAAAL